MLNSVKEKKNTSEYESTREIALNGHNELSLTLAQKAKENKGMGHGLSREREPPRM